MAKLETRRIEKRICRQRVKYVRILLRATAREKFEIVASLCEAQTAKEPRRKIFAEMLDRIWAGEAGGILAWHPNRLARNSIDGGKIIYLLDTGKIQDLKFPTFWFDSTPQE